MPAALGQAAQVHHLVVGVVVDEQIGVFVNQTQEPAGEIDREIQFSAGGEVAEGAEVLIPLLPGGAIGQQNTPQVGAVTVVGLDVQIHLHRRPWCLDGLHRHLLQGDAPLQHPGAPGRGAQPRLGAVAMRGERQVIGQQGLDIRIGEL